MKLQFILATILLNTHLAACFFDEDIPDHEMIDPFDMGSYDPSAKYHSKQLSDSSFRIPRKPKNIQEPEEVEEERIEKKVAWTVGTKAKDTLYSESSKEVSLASADVVDKTKEHFPKPPNMEKMHMRRIIKGLLSKIDAKPDGDFHGTARYPLIANLDSRSLAVLNDFVSTDVEKISMKDLDDVMTNMFEKGDDCVLEKKYCIEVDSWRNFFSSVKRFCIDATMDHLDIWLAIGLVLSLILVAVYVSRSSPLYASVVLLGTIFFCLSWHSHYQLLMQRAMAKRQSDMAKMTAVPLECKPHEMQLHQSLWHWTKTTIFMADDPCDKYYQVLLTDPTLEVTALVALWDLTATVFFHPLDHVGDSLGKFFGNFLGNLSLFKGIVVTVVLGIVSMFLLLMICGYQIRLPFWLGGIEPAIRQYAPPPPPPPQRVEDLITNQLVASISKKFSEMSMSASQGATYTVLDQQTGEQVIIRRPSVGQYGNQVEPVEYPRPVFYTFENQQVRQRVDIAPVRVPEGVFRGAVSKEVLLERQSASAADFVTSSDERGEPRESGFVQALSTTGSTHNRSVPQSSVLMSSIRPDSQSHLSASRERPQLLVGEIQGSDFEVAERSEPLLRRVATATDPGVPESVLVRNVHETVAVQSTLGLGDESDARISLQDTPVVEAEISENVAIATSKVGVLPSAAADGVEKLAVVLEEHIGSRPLSSEDSDSEFEVLKDD